MACKYRNRVWYNGWCNVACRYCTLTQESTCKHNKQTNADKIRAMSDEELASFMAGKYTEFSQIKMLEKGEAVTATGLVLERETWFRVLMQWLQQPAEGTTHEG